MTDKVWDDACRDPVKEAAPALLAALEFVEYRLSAVTRTRVLNTAEGGYVVNLSPDEARKIVMHVRAAIALALPEPPYESSGTEYPDGIE